MNLTIINRDKIARELALITENGSLSPRGIAELLRRPLCRWGLSPRRAILRYAREQLDAAGLSKCISAAEVGKVLDRLQALGECQEVFVGHERYVVPCAPRWIPTGEGTASLLSVNPIPRDIIILEPTNQDDVVRRIRVANEDDMIALHFAEVRQCSIDDWIRPLGYLIHGGRRLGTFVRNDMLPLEAFWDLLVGVLVKEGHQLSEEAEVRIVTGPPGSFFGRYDTPDCEGRWSVSAEDGVWCGYRRGYGDAHWHPVIVEINNNERRVLDLYDRDEWCWALLARGRSIGFSEYIVSKGLSVGLSFPPPTQLMTAMDLLGPRSGGWSWSLLQEGPDFWSILR